jgi:DNA-directed RNA polymerase subunit H
MTHNSSGTISELYKSRLNLLELLTTQGYDTKDYEGFSVNEVHAMYMNKQLDLLLNYKSGSVDERKVYVKYHLAKTLRRENINDLIDDLYNLEQILTKKDTLIIIMKQDPNDTLISILKHIWEQEGIFIIIFGIHRLQFNLLKHEYVPHHEILSEDDVKEIKIEYNITDNAQIPEISRFDPVAQAIGMRPGQICKITRPSKTAISSEFYRICSQ